jgi:hypothetical protein
MACSNSKSAEQLKDFNYFPAILSKRSSTIYDKIHFKYQRGTNPSESTYQKNKKRKKELRKAARDCKVLTANGSLVEHGRNGRNTVKRGEVLSLKK